MNKAEFLSELNACLMKMQKQEREKFITYYDEMISDYVEAGMSEKDAVQKVGIPMDIAREILSEADTIVLPLPNINNKAILVILLILGFPLWGSLLLSAILLILCAYLVLLCIPFATGLFALSFLCASLVGIIGFPFVMNNGFAVGLTQLGLGIASLGLSIYLAYITVPLSKYFANLIKMMSLHFYTIMKRGLKL